jgi:acyl-CoA thioesterase I
MKYRVTLVMAALIALAGLCTGCERRNETGPGAAPQPSPASFEGTIVAFGDSLTAGLGVDEEDAYPARLEKKLHSAGYDWRVVNAGISGETSSGALSRVSWVLKLKPDIVILETGANDGLRGIDPNFTRKNIDETIRILKKHGVVVVVAGMKMFSNLGRGYTKAFAAMYPDLARKRGCILVPFFLDKVAAHPALNQADGMHPTAEGYRIVVDTVYPFVREAIERERRERGKNAPRKGPFSILPGPASVKTNTRGSRSRSTAWT